MGHLILPPSMAIHDFAALLLALSYLQAGKPQETAALLHVERHVIGKWLKRFNDVVHPPRTPALLCLH